MLLAAIIAAAVFSGILAHNLPVNGRNVSDSIAVSSRRVVMPSSVIGGIYPSDFVTNQHNKQYTQRQSWYRWQHPPPLPHIFSTYNFGESDQEGQFTDLNRTIRRRFEIFDQEEHRQRYGLRYKPVAPMPRLFWHKLPQQEEPSPSPSPADPTTDPPVTVVPEPPEPEPETQPPMPEEPEPTVPAEPEPTDPPVTTTTTSTVKPPTRPTPGTTMTSIMRPPIKLKPPLKNLLIYGSPFHLNFLEKKKHTSTSPSKVKSKSKGFLSLFEVIKFDNVQCSVSMGDIRSMVGVCYHEFECKNMGGIPTERCADGAGVCCIFLTGCGDATEQPVVYFESPNYPNPFREMMMCALIVNLRKNVLQLRIDFIMFELNRPTDGDCIDDQFIITGHNINFIIPILCGINTGQHIYVHVGDSTERKVYLSFFAKVVSANGRSFNLKVTQLESDTAPDGCLQYFKEPEGILKSFNYDRIGLIVDNFQATYLNNLNYVMCIQRLKGVCSLLYTTEQIGGDLQDFQIINKNADEGDLVSDGQAGAGIFNCPDDFIAINQVRLCGERLNDGTDLEDFTLNAPVRDISAGPFILPFRSDEMYVGRGFRLIYRQEACV